MNRRALATVAVAACLLTACTGDPEPKIADPSPTPSVSSSASPSLTEAVDPEGPYREFIDAYVGAISTSLSTGDPGPWLAMSDPACENCAIVAKNLTDAYAAGGRIEGALWEVNSATYQDTGNLGQIWNVDVSSAEETWYDADGGVLKVVDAGLNLYGFAILDESGALRVRELRFRTT